MKSSASKRPTCSAEPRTSGLSSCSSSWRSRSASGGSAAIGSIRERGLDGGKLGLGVGVGLVGLAGAGVPVAGVAGVALDLVPHGMDPARGGVRLVLLHDLVRAVPIAGDGEVHGAGQVAAVCHLSHPVRRGLTPAALVYSGQGG